MFAELVAIGTPSFGELIVIMAIGLLLFGRRLPEIARGVGRSIVEFKRGLKDIESESDTASSRKSASDRYLPPQNSQRLPDPAERTPSENAAK